MDKKERNTFIKKLITSGLGLAALLGGIYLVMYLLGWTDLTREELQAFVASKGAWAPLIYVIISFLQVTFVPIPGAVTILAGNYVFGTGPAFLYSYIGMLLGAMFAFWLGRVLGRRFADWLSGSREKTDEWVRKLKGRENILLFFMFLLPFFPDDLLCAIAGLFPMSWLYFLLMQLITRATSIGGTLLFMSGEIIPFHGWGLAVLGAVAVLLVAAFIVCFRYAEQINARVDKCIDRLLHRKHRKE